MENQLLIGRIVKLLGEMRRRRKFFWSNVHERRRSPLREVTANVEKAVFAVVLCAHLWQCYGGSTGIKSTER